MLTCIPFSSVTPAISSKKSVTRVTASLAPFPAGPTSEARHPDLFGFPPASHGQGPERLARRLHAICRLALLLCFATCTSQAHSTIYKLEDEVRRITIYSNKPIHLSVARSEPPERSPPAPPAPPAPPVSTPLPPAPIRQPEATPLQAPPSVAGSGPKPPVAALNESRRIPPAVQKVRDSERLSILHNELQVEQAALADALSRKAGSEMIHRYQSNIEALKREIALTK